MLYKCVVFYLLYGPMGRFFGSLFRCVFKRGREGKGKELQKSLAFHLFSVNLEYTNSGGEDFGAVGEISHKN